MASKLNFHSNIFMSPCFCHSSFLSSSSSLSGFNTPNKLLFFGVTPSRMQSQQALAPMLSRRLFLPSVSGIWDALTGANSSREAVIAIRRGMQIFRQGDVLGSLAEFDRAIELDPRQKAYLWQRGLSLYYLDRFEEGSEQFRLDVAQNPNDTEESIWCFLCEAQLYGVDEARRRFLKATSFGISDGSDGCYRDPGVTNWCFEASIGSVKLKHLFNCSNHLHTVMQVGIDPRPVMREAYNMFKDGGDPEKLVSSFLHGQEHEYFYASLYAGLYYESQNNPDAAKLHLLAACLSPYGSRSDDYMASLAKVHCLCRNWTPK
ncbi:hypothetical protein HHK36_032142 [Tetracentron sinense]|uniref:Uncharacterized protein n=1 Tax=Tetracentron sinense TaxID=13715 RepID=A0A834Y9L1_TETSI|nr:hypothetical protein HHK36_032142 [Tetracentron sinense]